MDRTKHDSQSRPSRAVFTTRRLAKCIETIQIKQRSPNEARWKRGSLRNRMLKPRFSPGVLSRSTVGIEDHRRTRFSTHAFEEPWLFHGRCTSDWSCRGCCTCRVHFPGRFSHGPTCGNRSRSLHPVHRLLLPLGNDTPQKTDPLPQTLLVDASIHARTGIDRREFAVTVTTFILLGIFRTKWNAEVRGSICNTCRQGRSLITSRFCFMKNLDQWHLCSLNMCV